jgi:hypothetical protein
MATTSKRAAAPRVPAKAPVKKPEPPKPPDPKQTDPQKLIETELD